MTELVACLSTGTGAGTLAHLTRVMEEHSWDKVFLIANELDKDKFKADNVEMIIIDSNRFLPELVEDIKNQLKDRITGTEVAVNLISGTGKEHMAVLSALLKLGLGIRLVALTKSGVKEI